jgi:hypothetical protein
MATETWYEASTYSDEVRELKVVAESATQVTLQEGVRRYKTASGCWIRKTREEAIDALLENLEADVSIANEVAKSNIAGAEYRLKQARRTFGASE